MCDKFIGLGFYEYLVCYVFVKLNCIFCVWCCDCFWYV